MATEAGGGGLLPQYPSLSVTANYPRTFTFAEWIEHFKAMATINKINGTMLRNCCGGRNPGCVPTEAKESCAELKKGASKPKLLRNAIWFNFRINENRRMGLNC